MKFEIASNYFYGTGVCHISRKNDNRSVRENSNYLTMDLLRLFLNYN